MTSRPKVLLVSVYPDKREVRRPLLEAAGYEVLAVNRPEDALDACAPGGCELVVIGSSLPFRQRLLVCTDLRTLYPSVRIVIASEPQHRSEAERFADVVISTRRSGPELLRALESARCA